jgi:hypothetical protein
MLSRFNPRSNDMLSCAGGLNLVDVGAFVEFTAGKRLASLSKKSPSQECMTVEGFLFSYGETLLLISFFFPLLETSVCQM